MVTRPDDFAACHADLIEGTHYPAVHRLATELSGPGFAQRLEALWARWLYSACLGFALPVAEQERTGFHYEYSLWQLELSRNDLFHPAAVLEEVFQKLIDRTRAPLDLKVLETIFGRRHRQPTKKPQRAGRSGFEVAKEVEASSGDVTVWRVRWGQVVLKIHDKAGRVLRVEVKGLNTAVLGCGKRLEKLADQLTGMQGLRERFLASLPAAPAGFLDEAQSPTRRAAYDLAKLRGKGLIERMPERRRSECRPEQLRVLGAYVLLREPVIKPVLAGMTRKALPPSPPKLRPLDQHYLTLRGEFQRTCQTLGLAA